MRVNVRESPNGNPQTSPTKSIRKIKIRTKKQKQVNKIKEIKDF